MGRLGTTHAPDIQGYRGMNTLNFTIAECIGDICNTKLQPWQIDQASLVKKLSKPLVGIKDGSYFIRSNGTHRSNVGTADTAHILILDGDSYINIDGEFISGAPAPNEVSQTLTKLRYSHYIYSSYSNGATQAELSAKHINSESAFDSDYHKYRVIIPCTYTPEQLPILLDHIFTQLHQDGVMLANVKENSTWSQAWYFPRVPDAQRVNLFQWHQYEGTAIDTSAICNQWAQANPIKAEPKKITVKIKIDESNGRINSIKIFNQTYSVHNILTRNGYIQKGQKYLRPNSESKIPGIQLCKSCNDGVERIYSHGGDLLNDGFAHDAFDCYRFLELGETSPKPTVNAFNWDMDIQKHNQRIGAIEKATQQPKVEFDINNLLASQERRNSTEQKENMSKVSSAPKNTLAFKLLSAGEVMTREINFDWQIKGLFERKTYGQIFGATGSGKSFVVLEMAYCIASGIDYHSHETKQGNVVYICGEGFSGLNRRLKALQEKYNQDIGSKFFISEQPGAFTDAGVTSSVCEAIRAVGDVSLVIIDTLHRNMGDGDENSSSDFGKFLRNIDIFLKPLGVTVLIIHHSGHESTDRSRGTSSIRCAWDFEFKTTLNSQGLTLSNTKVKDGPTPAPMLFDFVPVTLGEDEDGEPITSAVLDFKEGVSVQSIKKRKLSARDDAVLQTLSDALAQCGIEPSTEIKAKFGGFDSLVGRMQKVVHVDRWRELAYKTISVDTETDENITASLQKAFRRCRDKLFNDKYTVEYGQYVWRVFEEKES